MLSSLVVAQCNISFPQRLARMWATCRHDADMREFEGIILSREHVRSYLVDLTFKFLGLVGVARTIALIDELLPSHWLFSHLDLAPVLFML